MIDKLGHDLDVYKVCRVVNPFFAKAHLSLNTDDQGKEYFRELLTLLNQTAQPDGEQYPIPHVDVFSPEEVASMLREVKEYKFILSNTALQDAPNYKDQMGYCSVFWQAASNRIPSIAKLAKYAFTLVSSSATAERVFSILKRHFSIQQLKSILDDQVETSVMLAYNNRNYEYAAIMVEDYLDQEDM